MLVRTFRLTDRLGNSLLRMSAWAVMSLAEQADYATGSLYRAAHAVWRVLAVILGAVWMVLYTIGSILVRGAMTLAQGTAAISRRLARRTGHTVQSTYETASSRHQDIMVQRATEAEMKPAIAKDPLLAQNRALSAFAVLLLLLLLAVVVIQTTSDDNGDELDTIGAGAPWTGAENATPTPAPFPTNTPTITPVPGPLRGGGSLVYALRERGQLDLWAIGVGEEEPIRLTSGPADDRDPAWSPDGTRIAFASNRDDSWDLYVLDIRTGNVSRLTSTPGFEGAPSWSPDGLWLAYEGYTEAGHLDIFIISSDPAQAQAEGARQVTYFPGPDIEPAWAPGAGRQLAYASWRDGNYDIVVIDLGSTPNREESALNLTNTPDINESYPAWSPDGSQIAYSTRVNGVEGVYAKALDAAQDAPVLVGLGQMPAWAPNGTNVVYVQAYQQQSQLVADSISGFGRATDALALPNIASDPDWTATGLPAALVQDGGFLARQEPPPLYEENADRKSDGLYGLAPLSVEAPQAYLSDTVNDSFEALRLRVAAEAGYDFLGVLEDALWLQNRAPEPGQPRENWHYTGRAFAIDRKLAYIESFPRPIEIVREDIDVYTYWRVYLRVADGAQNGVLGEPLRDAPWDFVARSSGDEADYNQGGRVMDAPPPGYYVDLTQLAEDYGWERLPAGSTWRYNSAAIQYWEFAKTDGLSWEQAMLELYTPQQLEEFFAEATRVPPPPPAPTASPTPAVRRTSTPLPPDQQ